jgi:glycerophosphoryl diester phosphodiesterase
MQKFTLFFMVATIAASCNSSKKNVVMNEETKNNNSKNTVEFDKQGHRGCRGLMPENTVPAMLYAIGLGVTTLEMDVVITKDKKVILSHEPFFNHEISTPQLGHFTNTVVTAENEKSLNIYNMTYAATQQIDVGLKPHPRFPQQKKMAVHKPLLSDVFDSVKNYMMTARRPFPFYNIETKTTPATDNIYHPAPAEFVELLMAVIKEKQMEDFVIIQSFDIRTLQYLHQHYPTIKTALLIENFDKRNLEVQLKALGFNPTIYSPAQELVNESLINKCHQQNIQVIPWTVNDKVSIEKFKKMGVDGILTDYPNLFNE